MKILYLTPTINDPGGVARVLSIKSNYFIEKYNYEVHFITQNQSNSDSFFEFNSNIIHHNIERKGNKFQNFFYYKNQLQKLIDTINPDIILICDFGYKGFCIPFIIKTKIPIIFEAHGSIYNESQLLANNFFIKKGQKLKYSFRKFCANKFDAIVVLSNESLKEWDVKKSFVLPNPNWLQTENIAALKNKKVIAVARHSYEKGLDRLLIIWQKVQKNNPDWTLDIYGNVANNVNLLQLAIELKLEKSVNFFEPVHDIEKKYLDASVYLMTSRSEGFPMVLIEAMSVGLPIIAYNCPIGPKALLINSKNGFLIEDGSQFEFISKLELLFNDEKMRIEMGKNAKESVQKYNLNLVMNQWTVFIDSIINS